MNYQNILIITCKNGSRSPLKSRAPRLYRGNDDCPMQGIDTYFLFNIPSYLYRGNDDCPMQGIDTCHDYVHYITFYRTVEMMIARCRALTQIKNKSYKYIDAVEMMIARCRALTHCQHANTYVVYSIVEMMIARCRALTQTVPVHYNRS